jgi:hypothetical protein
MVPPPHPDVDDKKEMHPLEKCGLSRQESFDAFNDLVGEVMDERESATSYEDTDSTCIRLLYASYFDTLIGVKHPDLTDEEKKEASELKSLKKNRRTWLPPILFESHYFINVVRAELYEEEPICNEVRAAFLSVLRMFGKRSTTDERHGDTAVVTGRTLKTSAYDIPDKIQGAQSLDHALWKASPADVRSDNVITKHRNTLETAVKAVIRAAEPLLLANPFNNDTPFDSETCDALDEFLVMAGINFDRTLFRHAQRDPSKQYTVDFDANEDYKHLLPENLKRNDVTDKATKWPSKTFKWRLNGGRNLITKKARKVVEDQPQEETLATSKSLGKLPAKSPSMSPLTPVPATAINVEEQGHGEDGVQYISLSDHD